MCPLLILLFNVLHEKNFHTQIALLSDLEFENYSKGANMQWVCNICQEQSKPIFSHIEAKLDLLQEMMPKINDLQDRNEHLENALTASDPKMEDKINDLIDKKIKEDIF